MPLPVSSTVAIVKVNRAPMPDPSLSAHIRPPCASTIPLQMARPWPGRSPGHRLGRASGETFWPALSTRRLCGQCLSFNKSISHPMKRASRALG